MSNYFNKIARALSKYILENRTIITLVWFGCAVIGAISRINMSPSGYNNYLIFKGSIAHILAGNNLYAPYPDMYCDMFHYGPLFGLIIAPFAALPDWAGLFLWLTASTALLYWAVRLLPLSARDQSIVMLISINELFTAIAMQQFNINTVALIVMTFVLIERRREGWAALMIIIGTFVKIYGIVGLAFFFFVQRKWRFVALLALWGVVMFMLPALFSSPDYIFEQYRLWFYDIQIKNIQNEFAIHQNISLLGMVRKITATTNYSNLSLILPAIAIFGLPYLRISQYRNVRFRLMILASAFIFTVLMSTGSETNGYITAAIGVAIWWVASPTARTGWVDWSLLALVMVVSFAGSIFTRSFYDNVIFAYALKALPFTLVWIKLSVELCFRDFYKAEQISQNN